MKVLLVLPRHERARRMRATKYLLNGLGRNQIPYTAIDPLPDMNWENELDDTTVALFWMYGYKAGGLGREYLMFYNLLVPELQKRGVPILPSPVAEVTHYDHLSAWRDAGIPCPNVQLLSPETEISLEYPIILRENRKLSKGKAMYIAENKAEADRIRKKFNSDLAVEYIDTKSPDGWYRKYRTLVVGERAIPEQAQLSRHWMVHQSTTEPKADRLGKKETRKLMDHGDSLSKVLINAAKAIEQPISAFDYSIDKNGEIVIWEANRLVVFGGMDNLRISKRMRAATDLNAKDWIVYFEEYVDSICTLLKELSSEKKSGEEAGS